LTTISSDDALGRCSEFDRGFMPTKASSEERWKRLDWAFWRGEELPAVSLYKVGGFYFVLDGHHRVSVASYHGAKWIDAYVTEFGAPSGIPSPVEPARSGIIEEPNSICHPTNHSREEVRGCTRW
jgi:hypothetical protein